MKKYIFIILLLQLLNACKPVKPISEELEIENRNDNIISFLVLNICNDSKTNKKTVKLINKSEAIGTFKKQQNAPSLNYLTIYSYSKKQIVDSLILEHPLYKHFEYLNDSNNFEVKDTIIDNSDFYIRLQNKCDEIKIFETINANSTKFINAIKN